MSEEITRWDVTEYLNTEADIAAYLNAVVEENDPMLLQAALGDIAKARGMSNVARAAGVGRESLYKSLSISGNPSFQTIVKVSRAFGLKMVFEPVGVGVEQGTGERA